MSSLRARLLVWLLGGVLLVGVAGGLVVYRNALAEADAFFDYHLRQTALLLRDQPVEYLLAPQFPPATTPPTTSSSRSGRSTAGASTCRARTRGAARAHDPRLLHRHDQRGALARVRHRRP